MLLGLTCLTAELLVFKRTVIATKKRFETVEAQHCLHRAAKADIPKAPGRTISVPGAGGGLEKVR